MSFQCIQKTKMKENGHLVWINQLNKWHPAKNKEMESGVPFVSA